MVLGLVTRWARARGPKRPPKAWRLAVPVALVATVVPVLAQSAAAASSLDGQGPNYCAGAQRGGYNLGPDMQTEGGRVYACGPVPVDGHGDTGPAVPKFWPIRRGWVPVHGAGHKVLIPRYRRG